MIPLDQWITNHEGVRLHAYTDTTGHQTIGIGHNLADGIPLPIVLALRDSDIKEAQKDILINLPWLRSIDTPRFDALTHLCFWVGIGEFLGFKNMLAAVKTGDWQTASNEILNSKLASDIPERAKEIATRLLSGDTP